MCCSPTPLLERGERLQREAKVVSARFAERGRDPCALQNLKDTASKFEQTLILSRAEHRELRPNLKTLDSLQSWFTDPEDSRASHTALALHRHPASQHLTCPALQFFLRHYNMCTLPDTARPTGCQPRCHSHPDISSGTKTVAATTLPMVPKIVM